MECSFAITGKDFVLIAADTTAARSIVKMKGDEDKMRVIGDNLVFAYSGEPGDTIKFAEYIEANLKLNAIRNHTPVRPAPAASWIRSSLATSIRSRSPYSVNLLLAGWDPTEGTSGAPSVYWIDYLGTIAKVPFAAQGYGSYFALATMDRYHDPTSDLEGGLALMRRCVEEVEKRLIVSLGKFKVRVIDTNGVREIDLYAGHT